MLRKLLIMGGVLSGLTMSDKCIQGCMTKVDTECITSKGKLLSLWKWTECYNQVQELQKCAHNCKAPKQGGK